MDFLRALEPFGKKHLILAASIVFAALVVLGVWYEQLPKPLLEGTAEYVMEMHHGIGANSDFEFPQVIALANGNEEAFKKIHDRLVEVAASGDCTTGRSDDELKEELKGNLPYRDDLAGYTDQDVDGMSRTQVIQTLGWYSAIGTASIVYNDHDILSISAMEHDECGGAHPNDWDISMTFDMRTGKEVKFQDLFADYAKDGTAINAVLLGWYREHQTPYYLDAPNDLADCIDAVRDSFDYATYTVSSDGIDVDPSLPRVVMTCGGQFHVPLESLTPYFKPDSVLSRLPAAAANK